MCSCGTGESAAVRLQITYLQGAVQIFQPLHCDFCKRFAAELGKLSAR
jgi:hypothetical protein